MTINIDDLTIGQLKQLQSLIGGQKKEAAEEWATPHIGKTCIIRTYASGVFIATVAAHDGGRVVELHNARRLWRFDCNDGIELISIAVHGTDNASPKTRTSCAVEAMTVLDALEIIPCTPWAAEIIYAAPDAQPEK